MIKKVHKEDMKNIRFAIQKKSQDHREHEEDVFELITAAVPPVSQALVRGGLHGPKLESVTRNKIFWLLFAHFPLEGIAMRQLPNAYQNKYDERLKDDQKSLIEQQMVDLLRFER
uniref:Uncharacterized protein n=1 Tax=Plectus sambesii TaxID=2011161 RepID=A0A914VLE5_9BILA